MQNKKKKLATTIRTFLQKVRNIRIMTSHTRNIEPINKIHEYNENSMQPYPSALLREL